MAEQEIFASLESVLEGIVERDKRDKERAVAPLVRADDAVEIDSTKVSQQEVVQTIIKLVTEARGQSS